jgi:L-lactate dehydrogenase complex protein LldE
LKSAETEAAKPDQVYLFATCLIDLFSPQSGLDAVELIESAGIRVEFPQAQTCCGQPSYTAGFTEDARAVAAAQLGLFPEPWPIVVPSGSCGGMLKRHWPELFADDPERLSRAQDIAGRVVELTDFLLQLDLKFRPADEQPVKVALHTTCSARREMNTLLAGREMLGRLPGVELVEHEHEPECCGFGGAFAVKHAPISAAMTRDKIEAIKAAGCDALISADCGCLMSMNGMLERDGSDLRGMHLASFVRSRIVESQ